MNNILSGTKYHASAEGVSPIDETNNLVLHLDIHSYGYEFDGHLALALRARFAQANLSAGA